MAVVAAVRAAAPPVTVARQAGRANSDPTSLKTSAEISAATNPWWVYHPTLSNYVELLTSNQFLGRAGGAVGQELAVEQHP